MTKQNPSILSHLSLDSNRFDEAAAFYDQVLATLDCKRIMAHPGAIAWGREYPEFWLQKPIDGLPATVGNGTHTGFFAADRASVDAFYRAALGAGATEEGAPGPREEYGEPYYGCFVRDLDGHKIEALLGRRAHASTLWRGPDRLASATRGSDTCQPRQQQVFERTWKAARHKPGAPVQIGQHQQPAPSQGGLMSRCCQPTRPANPCNVRHSPLGDCSGAGNGQPSDGRPCLIQGNHKGK